MRTTLSVMLLLLTQAVSVMANVYVTTSGDTTRVWDTGVEWSCTGKFFPVTKISNDTISITERDTALLATCLCYFNVCTKVTGLQPGTYTVIVTRRHEERIGDSLYVFEELAGSVMFSISSPTSLLPGVVLFQSACRNTPESVGEVQPVPADFPLLSTYPNPFNPSTLIRYYIPKAGWVSLRVYNMLGQLITTLVSENAQAGAYEAIFDASNLSTGVYICQLISGELVLSGKMVLER